MKTALETLNVGQNFLTDEFVCTIKHRLIENKNVLRLGLQSTGLTSESAAMLAEILEVNNLIQVSLLRFLLIDIGIRL